jgi:hypothetical protein
MHQSLDPLCIPFLAQQPNISNTNQNISYEKTPSNATPVRSHHVSTTPLGVVTQFGVPMVESYVPLNQWHFQMTTNITRTTCCAIPYANSATWCFKFIKQGGPIVVPCFLGQLYNQHHPQGLEKFVWFCFGNMASCVGGVVLNLKHKKPALFNIWPINLSTNIIQCEANALGQVGFVFIHGTPLVTPTIEFNELCILPRVALNIRNECKTHVKQCLLTNMSRMKDVATLDAKVVNITFTPQGHTYIYELLVHESTINNLRCTYFVTISVFLSCTCLDFVSNATSSRHSCTSFLVNTCITFIMCV